MSLPAPHMTRPDANGAAASCNSAVSKEFVSIALQR